MNPEKRYQVFMSSTFRDLIEERQAALQAVLELDHMPAGMELFPATDDSTWQLIKDVIDASDYYVVIVGGRYGSLDATGLGYTEREIRLCSVPWEARNSATTRESRRNTAGQDGRE